MRERRARRNGKQDGRGVVKDLADGDRDWPDPIEALCRDLCHLLELLISDMLGWPDYQSGHVQTVRRCHVKSVERDQAVGGLAGEIAYFG